MSLLTSEPYTPELLNLLRGIAQITQDLVGVLAKSRGWLLGQNWLLAHLHQMTGHLQLSHKVMFHLCNHVIRKHLVIAQ